MRGLSDALNRLSRIRSALPVTARRAVSLALNRALNDARINVPVDTGFLRDSLRVTPPALGGALTTDCPYAARVERRSPFLAPTAKRAGFPEACADAVKEALHD